MADLEKGTVNKAPGAVGGVNNGITPPAAPYGGNAPYGGGAPRTRIGNPGPLGLTSFASTTLLLSFVNVNTRGVGEPNVVVGMALFVGGLAQLLAGMWEFAVGNTFGATAFTGYGSFWMSYATILIPGSGILAAYSGDAAPDLAQALGLYLLTWFIFTSLLFIAALRRNIGFVALLGFLAITFLLLGVGNLKGSVNITKAGGALGIITAFIAYYCAMAELLRPEDSWFTLPLGHIRKRAD